MPAGIRSAVKLPKIYDMATRRKVLGALIYSSTSATQAAVGSGAKQFEIGQVLEFGAAVVPALQPMLVADSGDIRHDTNLLDYAALGLQQSDLDTILADASSTMQSLESQLNLVRQQRIDAELALSDNQILLNEVGKAVAALGVLQAANGDPALIAILDKLTKQATDLLAVQATLVAAGNNLATQASDVQDQIRQIAQIVR